MAVGKRPKIKLKKGSRLLIKIYRRPRSV